MVQDLLTILLTPSYLIPFAVRWVISGVILFITAKFVGAKGGLLSAIGVAFLSTVITVMLLQTYVSQLLNYDATDIVSLIQNNIFGLVLSYVLPAVVWFFLVMILMKVGPMHALMIAFVQWVLGVALAYFGLPNFISSFTGPF